MSLFQIFQFDFIVHAFEAGIVLGIIAPIVGLFLVVRRYSLLADALAHVSLLGVALALFFKIPVFIGALITAFLSALGMEKLRMEGKVLSEAIIALFLSSSLALSIVIIGLIHGLNANLFSYLFGSLATVSGNDVTLLVGLALIIVLFLLFSYRALFLFSIDEELALVSGVRVQFLNFFFVALAAVTVVAAMQIVGALLVGALMVVPVLTAMQWRKGFRATLLLSIIFSLVSVLSGFVLAYQFNLASGGSIVLVAVLFFILSYIATRSELPKNLFKKA